MYLADSWHDYEIIDAGDGEKLDAGEALRCLDPTRRRYGPWAQAIKSRTRTIYAPQAGAGIGNTTAGLKKAGP